MEVTVAVRLHQRSNVLCERRVKQDVTTGCLARLDPQASLAARSSRRHCPRMLGGDARPCADRLRGATEPAADRCVRLGPIPATRLRRRTPALGNARDMNGPLLRSSICNPIEGTLGLRREQERRRPPACAALLEPRAGLGRGLADPASSPTRRVPVRSVGVHDPTPATGTGRWRTAWVSRAGQVGLSRRTRIRTA